MTSPVCCFISPPKVELRRLLVTIRIVLVEDDPIVHDTVTLLLATASDMALVGQFTEQSAAPQALPQLHPDMVLVDLGLPNGSGLELIREGCAQLAETEFLVLTVFDRAEATGYLVKQDLPTELVEAIRRVYRGASWMPTGVARWVLELFRQELRSRSPPCCLTAREQEILNGLS